MSAKPHTFNDIFGSSFGEPVQQVKLKKILIPLIQRDYAQGRIDPETKRIRERFLGSLHDALTGLPLTLDFVYGDLDSNGIMTPLDGQQRLTTLFLLYWFAAKKEGIEPKDYAFLGNFSYETRYSSRDFCAKLVEFNPTFAYTSLSKEIVDQPWFPYDWEKDPTISSMLVMLDAIEDKFADVADIWGKLLSGCINFYFLPIKDLGLADDLYIKMNSTGKPLTLFEDFKAELEHSLSEVGAIKDLIYNIDLKWTDMLWTSKKTDDVIDDEFLRYFRFICDVISIRQDGGAPHDKDTDVFDLLEQYFSKRSEHLEDNIALLNSFFDCWCKLETSQDEFFASIMANAHEEGKILVRDNLNIFSDCRANYGDAAENGNRKFTLQRFILLYAVIYYLIHKASISFDDFKRRLRIVNNLIENSEDEIASRAARNNLPAILKQVEKIIGEGSIDLTLGANFNSSQLDEEREKLAWTSAHQDLAESLFRLEDHPLLKGQIAIVGLDHPEYFSRFEQLFPPRCSEERFDLIDCALMSKGNYGQRESNGWRWQFGSSRNSSAWESLFHGSKSREFFKRTKDIVRQLLSNDDLSDDGLRRMAQEFVDDCKAKHRFVWRYYYVAYQSFRPGRYGKYWIESEKPYLITTMLTQRNVSETSRQAFLYEVGGEEHIDKDSKGKYLLYESFRVRAENRAFVIESRDDEHKELDRIKFPHDENGVDTEDRIQKAKRELPDKIARFQN